MKGNQVLNGSFGKLWVDGVLMANVKSFEAKVSGEFEDVKIANKLGTEAKYMGYSIEGTATLHKVDSAIAKKVAKDFATGKMNEIQIVASIDDPNASGVEKIQLDGVYFTELTLINFEVGAMGEEEVPFRATSFKYLNQI